MHNLSLRGSAKGEPLGPIGSTPCDKAQWMASVKKIRERAEEADGPFSCFSRLTADFVTDNGKQLVREKLDDAEAAWQGHSTWGNLRNMEGQFLAKNGSLSSFMQTACLRQMLPPAKRKLLRITRKEDTVSLWLTRDNLGLIRETEPDGRPSWILTSEPQARK